MKANSYKTNINCAGCIAKVTDALDQTVGKNNWSVDIKNPNKILTIANPEANADTVMEALKKVGYKMEAMPDTV